jgi:porin
MAPAGWAAEANPLPSSAAADQPWHDALLGGLGGLRPWLAGYGARLELSEISEILGNPVGGVRRGAIYEGLADLGFGIDLRPRFHWPGAVFARAYQIHGRGLTANNLANLNTASGIEASRTTRLHELWYEQYVGDRVRVRLGQQSAGQEFQISEAAQIFINGAFGWPTLASADLPSGGPGFPLGTPGVRLRVDPDPAVTLLAGAFNGDPAGPGVGDPQRRDASGTAFRLDDGVLAMVEMQYKPGKSDASGTYKIGAWVHTGRSYDQRFDSAGAPLASLASNGIARRYHSNFSVYATVDQPLSRGPERGLTVFARAMGAPGDRNLVDLYGDAGLVYTGPFGRSEDSVAGGFGYARISSAARGFDADMAGLTGQRYRVRSAEGVLEITYRMQLTPWWQLQPDFQYILNPGGGAPDPNKAGRRVRDAAVFGLRTTVTF